MQANRRMKITAPFLLTLTACQIFTDPIPLEDLALLDKRCPGAVSADGSLSRAVAECLIDMAAANPFSNLANAVRRLLRPSPKESKEDLHTLPESAEEWEALISVRKKIREAADNDALEFTPAENRAYLRYIGYLK